MNSALGGLRVLDFTTTIAGPHCTRLMADLGAEVIKIEAPEGDMMRTRPPLRDGASTSFGQLNAGKKSIVLDLKRPAAVAVVHRLVATADIVVENFRPGVMRALRPRLSDSCRRSTRPDLLRDFGLRPDRPVGRPAGLRAGDPRHFGLRSRADGASDRAAPAGLLRHLHRRRAQRHLCVWRGHGRAAISARRPARVR